jgi:hypothetical protein
MQPHQHRKKKFEKNGILYPTLALHEPDWAASMKPKPHHFKKIQNHMSNTLVAQKPKWGSFYEPKNYITTTKNIKK